MTVGVVLVVYTIVPPRSPSLRSAAVPAIVAGLGVYLLGQVFLFVAPRIVGVAALAGSLATAFIALAWLSLSFQILLLGASWVRVRDDANTGAEESADEESALLGPAAPAKPGIGGE